MGSSSKGSAASAGGGVMLGVMISNNRVEIRSRKANNCCFSCSRGSDAFEVEKSATVCGLASF